MSDFNIQFLEGVTPGLSATVDVNAPPLMGIDVFTNAFLIPAAAPQQVAGVGRATGGAQNDTLACIARAQLIDIDSVRFTDQDAAGSFDNLVGVHVLEYVGGVGGPNEVIVRGVVSFNGTGTEIDSAAIPGIVDIDRTVVFATMGGNINSGAWTSHAGTAKIVNNGTDDVVRVTKVNSGNQLNIIAYVVEFTGSNWSVQKVEHAFSAAGTDEDETITAVTLANTFTYTTFMPGANLPIDNLFYVWLENGTTLRHRKRGSVSNSPTTYTNIISNPQLTVTVIGADPDDTADLAATGTSPETRNITISAVPDRTQCIVLGYMGSDQAGAANRPGGLTLMDLTSATNLRLRRSVSDGATEYKIQIIDFSEVNGGVIESVDPIVDGESFTITGVFAGTPTVEINGVEQTVTANDDASITCTAVLDENRYGTDYDLTVDNGSIVLESPVPVQIQAPITKSFVNLAPPLVPAANRLTTTPDLDGTEQIEWSLVIGGGTLDVLVYPDGAFSVAPGVTQFSFRAHDGTEWGTIAVQQVSAPVPPKTKAISCPLPTT